MIYRYPSFILDTVNKTVTDAHGKPLLIRGNSYEFLKLLCDKNRKHEGVEAKEFGLKLDPAGASELDHNDIRQLLYKFRIAVGRDIVSFNNKIYSLTESELGGEPLANVMPASGTARVEQPITSVPRDQSKKTSQAKRPAITKKENKRKIIIVGVVLICTALAVVGYLLFDKSSQADNGSQQPAIGPKSIKPNDDMVLIPAGDFIMGSSKEQIEDAVKNCELTDDCKFKTFQDEYPQQIVPLSEYFIDRTEVSNNDYNIFVRATGHVQSAFSSDSNLNQPNFPVVGITREDARQYCKWLNKRLPTEKEWEKAARGTDGNIWPWGNTWDAAKANHGKNLDVDESDGYKFTAPVGLNSDVSPFGVLNMAGNVNEWVDGSYLVYPENQAYGVSVESHLGKAILRGGSYHDSQSFLRAAIRWAEIDSNADVDIGFRCVR